MDNIIYLLLRIRTLEYLVATSYDKKSTSSLDFGSMQPNVDYQTDFQKALSLQQEKKFDDALSLYQKILDQNLVQRPDLSPEQLSQVSYNTALTYFAKQDFAKSFVYNQKALLLNPHNQAAKDFSEKLNSSYQLKSVSHDITLIENLNKAGFQQTPLEVLWILASIFLMLFIRGITIHFVNRKKQILENLKITVFNWKNYIWVAFFVVVSCLLLMKISDLETSKALIKNDQVILKTAPGENQASLTDLPIGSLVHILRTSQINNINYFQIKYPGGASGWVKQEEIEIVLMPKD